MQHTEHKTPMHIAKKKYPSIFQSLINPETIITCKSQKMMRKKKIPTITTQEKPNPTFRFQIKILNTYQTENKHATLIKEKLLKEINNSRTKLHKKKGKSFTYLFLGVCALY